MSWVNSSAFLLHRLGRGTLTLNAPVLIGHLPASLAFFRVPQTFDLFPASGPLCLLFPLPGRFFPSSLCDQLLTIQDSTPVSPPQESFSWPPSLSFSVDFEFLESVQFSDFWHGHKVEQPSPLSDPRTFSLSKVHVHPCNSQSPVLPLSIPWPPPPIYFLSLCICLLWTFHINRVIRSVAFGVWLLCRNIMFPGSIHVVPGVNTPSHITSFVYPFIHLFGLFSTLGLLGITLLCNSVSWSCYTFVYLIFTALVDLFNMHTSYPVP